MDTRKHIICLRCKEPKPHYGLGMCSPCLRRTKRQERPIYYLQTCYSEMSRRVKTYDPKRPRYYKMKKCSKTQFINKFLHNEDFLNLYKRWQESGFKRGSSPSIDRINNDKGYTLDNIQFISHLENSQKGKHKPVIDSKNNYFPSCKDAAEFWKIQRSVICVLLKTGKLNKKLGVTFKYA